MGGQGKTPQSCRLLLALVLGALGVHCDTERARDKRSDDLGPLETVVSGLSQQVTSLGAKLTAMESKMTALQSQHSQLQTKFDASQKQVAFLAHNSADPFNVAAAGTLVYNFAQTNIGGGYDTVTGVFTAPTSGLYALFVSCKSAHQNIDEDVGVLVEGRRVCGCYSRSQDFPIQGSSMATVHVNAGQRVWVHLYRDTGRDVRGGSGTPLRAFLLRLTTRTHR